MILVSDKPWTIIDGVTYFEPSSGMAHSIAFAMIHEVLVPSNGNKPAAANAAFSDEYREAYSSVILNFAQYKQWFLVLVACHQVRALTDQNMEAFFQMNNTREQGIAKFLKTLQYCSNNQALFANNPALRVKFETNRFFEYHTSATTTPALITRAINSCPIPNVFTAAELNAVAAAKASSHDIMLSRAIPENALFKARAILEALKISPPKWYMGQTAYENGNPLAYAALVKVIEKAGSLSTGVAITDATTMPECVDMFRALGL